MYVESEDLWATTGHLWFKPYNYVSYCCLACFDSAKLMANTVHAIFIYHITLCFVCAIMDCV